MKNLICILLAGLAISAQAQIVVEQPLDAAIVGQNILDRVEKSNIDKPLGKFTGEMTCGDVKLPTVNHIMSSKDSIINFDIKLINNRTGAVQEFKFSGAENIYSPISQTTSHTYAGMITKAKNPTLDPVALTKQPYVWTITPEQLKTGFSINLLPKVVDNNIVTQICYTQANLIGFKKFSPVDSDLANSPQAKKLEVDLPEVKQNSIFSSIVLVPHKEMVINLSPDTSLKIKANVVKYTIGT